MANIILLAMRAVQCLFAIIVLGLSAYVAHWYNADTLTASPSQINFLIFVPLFSMLSLLYLTLVPKFMPKAAHPIPSLAVEILNMLFHFAGFIALATFLSKLLFCRGSVCAAARADAVFAAFAWCIWVGTSAMCALAFFKGNAGESTGEGIGGGMKMGGGMGKLGGMFKRKEKPGKEVEEGKLEEA